MDKAKGRQYDNENVDQLIEEKNNSKPLECKGDGSRSKNLKKSDDKPKDTDDKPKDSNDNPKDSNDTSKNTDDKPKDTDNKSKNTNDKIRDKLKMNIKQIGGKKRNKKTKRKTKNLKNGQNKKRNIILLVK